MSLETRELYASPNGDHWYLARYIDSGRVFVLHVPTEPSGGKSDNIELSDSRNRPGNAPEKQALLRLIGTLVNGRSDVDPLVALHDDNDPHHF